MEVIEETRVSDKDAQKRIKAFVKEMDAVDEQIMDGSAKPKSGFSDRGIAADVKHQLSGTYIGIPRCGCKAEIGAWAPRPGCGGNVRRADADVGALTQRLARRSRTRTSEKSP